MKLNEKAETLRVDSLELLNCGRVISVVQVCYLKSSSILNKPIEAIAKNSNVL